MIDHDGYNDILARIRAEIAAGRVVYVHCWGGKGRTSTVVGCLLIDDGLDYDATIARIAELRAGTRKAIDPVPRVPVATPVASGAGSPASAEVSRFPW